jgi:hypothetical protein
VAHSATVAATYQVVFIRATRPSWQAGDTGRGVHASTDRGGSIHCGSVYRAGGGTGRCRAVLAQQTLYVVD